jgi:hypothetical protein
MSETKRVLKTQLSVRAYNVLSENGFFLDDAVKTAKKILNDYKNCGRKCWAELIEYAHSILNKDLHKTPVDELTLSKREWFAGMALQGMLANGVYDGELERKAFELADAMLKEGVK